MTPLGFRDLGLGSIVGNPTAAAVIATGSYGLIHGGSIRTPGSLVVTYDPTKPHNHGINLENYGVAPDVFVWNTPAGRVGRLRQGAEGGGGRGSPDAVGRAVSVSGRRAVGPAVATGATDADSRRLRPDHPLRAPPP